MSDVTEKLFQRLIELWNESDTDQAAHDWMGVTWDEYAALVEPRTADAEIERLRERSDALALQADEWEGKYAIVSDMNERLRLDLAAKDALHESVYRAGLKAGWNLCIDDNKVGYAKAMSGTEHIAELRRINEARRALGEQV